MKIRNFRDVFALIIGGIVFPLLWALHGTKTLNLPESIIGATIVIETLIAQFYWRKQPDAEKTV